jgi:Tol biopolymer transport system component
MPYETQPRFSPDGRQIAFTSDRGGGENIWLMNTDGSNRRQLTKETFTLLNNPTWSPDGRFIAARKHFTTQRSAGTGEVWMYHVAGGNGVALVERPNPQFQKELGEPMFTPDGSGIYFSRDVTPGNIFQYAQNSNDALFAIERYDLKTGERSTVAGGPGGAVRPQPSPDGRWLAYVKRERAKSKLYLKDLRSGEERPSDQHRRVGPCRDTVPGRRRARRDRSAAAAGERLLRDLHHQDAAPRQSFAGRSARSVREPGPALCQGCQR